jgi:sugar lactone lactonase YvrE
LWTGDLVSRTSTIVDAHSGALIGQVNTGALSNPHAIAFAPDGYRAYISDFTGRRLLVIRVQRPTLYLPLALNP